MSKEQPTIYIGIDVSKDKLSVALADGVRRHEVFSLGTFETAAASVDKLLKKLSGRASHVVVCYEARPRGMGFIDRCKLLGSNAAWSRPI